MVKRHELWELKQMQSLPLRAKIAMTDQRVDDWVYQWGEDGVYVSFSAGKDSTVLLHRIRQRYPDMLAVFVNTGLEYPEVVRHAMSYDNVVVLKPTMNFTQVIERYGYPFFSKEISDCIDSARKYIKILKERQTDRQTDASVCLGHSGYSWDRASRLQQMERIVSSIKNRNYP